ncbi:Ig-like domain-containing protein [Piscinibacterium candidicorallinum]|uniref:Ig-like domain-containing protein n=1 Tax=Piscinibacterium candidicorallinum TaxID=1793872 RepID=A0ABV7H2K3_9BURK
MTRSTRHIRAALSAAVFALLLAACGGGSGEPPPPRPDSVVPSAPPVVTITNNVSAEVATGPITFTFSFNRDVGTSFTTEDVVVTGGTKGAFARLSGTSATLVVAPNAAATGTVTITVPANSVTDATGTGNAAVSATKAFNTVAPPPPPPPASGPVVLANFDDIRPPVAGFEGAEGSAIEVGPSGGGSGNSFKVLRSGGQPFALGIIDTAVPFTATRRIIRAQVFSPLAGIPMVMKVEGPGGANSGDVQANEQVVVGWQTLTWTFSGIDPALTYNKIVLLPRLGTVDAPPGRAYYFDAITLTEPSTGATIVANFDDIRPPVAGFEGAEGSAIEVGPSGGGSGNSFKVLRSGGQPFALGIIDVVVPFTATRRTISAQVYSPLAGIPMVMKVEGPGGANSGDVQANEQVVVGWQTLTWTFSGIDPALTYNKIVLLPRLGTVDAPPGRAYYFDTISLLAASAGGGSGPLIFSTGFGTGRRTVEGGEYNGFSGSNLDGFNCNGAPENCGGDGGFVPSSTAADSFFFYYYQTATPAADLYMGIYVQAPGLVGGFSPSADTPGVQVGAQTTLRFKLGQNPEWFSSATNNFMIVMDLGKRYTAGGATCRLQLRRVVTPTAQAATDYAIPLSSFALVQDCGGAVTSVAQALAASPVSQISFQGVGGGIALSDGARTSGANRSVTDSGGRYPTTIVLQGGIRFD